MPKTFDFTVVRKAGLTQQEFADLIDGNRVTVNNWVRGRTNPHRMWHTRCSKYLTLLKAAIKLKQLPGDIPEPSQTTKDERARYIRDTLASVENTVRALKQQQSR